MEHLQKSADRSVRLSEMMERKLIFGHLDDSSRSKSTGKLDQMQTESVAKPLRIYHVIKFFNSSPTRYF